MKILIVKLIQIDIKIIQLFLIKKLNNILLNTNANQKNAHVKVIGKSGTKLGYAYNSTGSAKKAIFISAGNMISHERSLEIVKHVNKFRISETIRSADKISRILLAD
jgi:deoxyinosine 3'endonuclease (endonuclease V)